MRMPCNQIEEFAQNVRKYCIKRSLHISAHANPCEILTGRLEVMMVLPSARSKVTTTMKLPMATFFSEVGTCKFIEIS